MNDPTYDIVAGLLVRDFHVPRDTIQPGVSLTALGLDSLALMEFVFAIEDAFGLHIPEDRLNLREADVTLGRLCEIVQGAREAIVS